jgi:hypothetical protein
MCSVCWRTVQGRDQLVPSDRQTSCSRYTHLNTKLQPASRTLFFFSNIRRWTQSKNPSVWIHSVCCVAVRVRAGRWGVLQEANGSRVRYLGSTHYVCVRPVAEGLRRGRNLRFLTMFSISFYSCRVTWTKYKCGHLSQPSSLNFNMHKTVILLLLSCGCKRRTSTLKRITQTEGVWEQGA